MKTNDQGLPLHLEISHADSRLQVIEAIIEVLVRADLVTVGGAIGKRINQRIADSKPKKMKPVFHCEGTHNLRHKSASLPVTADWHDVNQAIAAMCNDGYEVVTVRREMVPE